MLELIFFLVDLHRKMRLSTGVAVYWLLNTIMDVKVKHNNNNKTSKGRNNSQPMQSTNKVVDEPKKVVVLPEVKRVLLRLILFLLRLRLLLFLLRLRFEDIRRRREWHDELVRVDGDMYDEKVD